VGPPQLRDFTLNGTVTRPAPAEEQPAPQTRQPSRNTTAVAPPPRNTPASEAPSAAIGSRADGTPSSATQVDASDLPPASAPVFEMPPPAPAIAEPAPAAPPATSSGLSSVPMLPWLVAGFALAGAVAWFFLRQRPRERPASGPTMDLFEEPEPSASEPVVRQAATPAGAGALEPPAPPQAAPAGIVSTRLRPWLEIEFNPDRAVVDEQKAAVAFELTVYNSGNGPARDVVIEASLFNAGPMQDQEIRLFFENPVGKGDKIPVIPPMKRITVNTAVFLARDQVRPIEMEGVSIDLFRRAVFRDGEEVHLTPKEFAVLAELAKHSGRVLTHAHLLRTAWGPAQESQIDYLRVAVRALRQKLERNPSEPRLIINEPAVGYRLGEVVEA